MDKYFEDFKKSLDDFKGDIYKKMSDLSDDVSFIKGVLDGRDWKRNHRFDKTAIIISIASLLITAGFWILKMQNTG